MPQIREQIAMVHLPPSKTLKYLFHVRKTSRAWTHIVRSRFGFFFFSIVCKAGIYFGTVRKRLQKIVTFSPISTQSFKSQRVWKP